MSVKKLLTHLQVIATTTVALRAQSTLRKHTQKEKTQMCCTKRKQTKCFLTLLHSFLFITSSYFVFLFLNHSSVFTLYFSQIFSFVFNFTESRSLLMSCSLPLERGRLPTTVRGWRRSSSITHRSDALLITDIFPRASTIRPRSWGLWRRLVVGSMCLFSPCQH